MNCVSTLQQTFKRIMVLCQSALWRKYAPPEYWNLPSRLCYVIKQITESRPLYIMLFILQPFIEFMYQFSTCWTIRQSRNIHGTTHLHTIYVCVHSVWHKYKWAHQTVVSQYAWWWRRQQGIMNQNSQPLSCNPNWCSA